VDEHDSGHDSKRNSMLDDHEPHHKEEPPMPSRQPESRNEATLPITETQRRQAQAAASRLLGAQGRGPRGLLGERVTGGRRRRKRAR
jgi:hypothetical protein